MTCTRTLPCFAVTWKHTPIEHIAVPRSHVRMSLLFEALEAARWRGLTDQAFDALSRQDKARVIAHYRTAVRLEAVIAWEQAKAIRRQTRRHDMRG